MLNYYLKFEPPLEEKNPFKDAMAFLGGTRMIVCRLSSDGRNGLQRIVFGHVQHYGQDNPHVTCLLSTQQFQVTPPKGTKSSSIDCFHLFSSKKVKSIIAIYQRLHSICRKLSRGICQDVPLPFFG